MALFLANLTRIVVAIIAVLLFVGWLLGKVTLQEAMTAVLPLLAAHAGASGVLDAGKSQ